MKLEIHPPTFSDSDLQAIAQSLVLCGDAVSRLVCLLQQVRLFRYNQIEDIPESEQDYLAWFASNLDQEICLALYRFLCQSGAMVDNYLDLDTLTLQCIQKIAPQGSDR